MPGKLTKAYIALGGNLGDREKNFSEALAGLQSFPTLRLKRGSPVYETPPMGPAGQDRYWNAVVEVEADLNPEDLLTICLEVEERLGRVRGERWGPRIIDLDLLLYGDLEWKSDRLILPHPEIAKRAFVLQPLVDLIPNGLLNGQRIDDLLSLVSTEGMIKVKEDLMSCRSSS